MIVLEQGEQARTSKQRLRLWLSLLRATRHVEAAVREEMRVCFATTLPRFDVLAALDRKREGMLMSELSQWLMVSNGNVTGIVERLVRDGLAERRRVPGDKRATRVRLTPEGIGAFATMAARHEQWVDRLLHDVDAAEAEHVTRILARIRKGRE